MRPSYLYITVLALVAQASAQINLSSIVSEAYSVYTEVTSIWNSDVSAASVAATASSGDTSSTTSSSSTSSTISSSSSSSTTSASSASVAVAQNSASQTASSAAASSTSAASPSHGTNHKTLAIVLGCVLGALALGLLILVLLLCCRRRRRDRTPSRVRSPEDNEVDSWRHNRSGDTGRPGSSRNLLGHNDAPAAGAFIGPSMAEHPAYRNQNHDNPFVPMPPPARRTAPNSRAGLTDSARPGDEPYLTDPKTGLPLNPNGSSDGVHKDRHKGAALAAGLGAAGLAGAALHHHHKKEDEKLASDHELDTIRGDRNRNPLGHSNDLPDYDHHRGEAVATGLAGAGLAGAAIHHHHKKEDEKLASDHELDTIRGDRNRNPLGHSNDLHDHDHHRGEAAAAGLGGAGLAGAAMHHHHNDEDELLAHNRERDTLLGEQNHDHLGHSNDPSDDNHHRGEAEAAGLAGAGLTGAALHHHHVNSAIDRQLAHNDERDLNQHDNLARDRNTFSSSPTLLGDDHGRNDHHKGEAIAAGLGGAALAGAAMHHHHSKQDEKLARDGDYERGLLRGDSLSRNRGSVTRKPVATAGPMSPVSPIESQDSRPFPTTTSNDDAFALNKVPSRRSGESARRASMSRERAALPISTSDGYSVPYDSTQRDLPQPNMSTSIPSTYSRVTTDHGNTNNSSHAPLVAGAAGLGAGALAGAAAAHHRDRRSSKSRSPSRRRRSFGLGGEKNRDSSSTSTTNSGSYDDAVPVQQHQPKPLSGTETRSMAAEMPEDVPPTPPTRSRRNSALGTGAPSAALGSRQNHVDYIPPVPVVVPQPSHADNSNTAHGWGNGYRHGERQRRDQTPPAVPSRSPKRTRFSDDVPFNYGPPSPGIVGDNRYPHMGVPSRRSGDDFERVVPVKNEGPAPGLQPGSGMDRDTSSEDSTWRLSSGMPGGWRKERTSSMSSAGRRPQSGGFFGRDSGIGTGSGGSRAGSMTSMSGNVGGNGRRLRLADLQREEEEKEREMRIRGRRSVENEWSGNGGYDGYNHWHPDGVGQAL